MKFFQTRRDDFSVKDFIEKLEKKAYARALRSIDLLRDFGLFLRMPYSKKIAPRLYELRIKFVYAFKKKSQKTPKREIKTALDRSQELT